MGPLLAAGARLLGGAGLRAGATGGATTGGGSLLSGRLANFSHGMFVGNALGGDNTSSEQPSQAPAPASPGDYGSAIDYATSTMRMGQGYS